MIKPIIMPVYNWHVYVAVGEIELLNLVKREGLKKSGGKDIKSCRAYSVCATKPLKNGLKRDIGLMYFHEDAFDVSTVVHESVHNIHQMMESRGIPVDDSNTEVMAYSTEYLVREVIKRHKRKLKFV